MSFIKRGLSKIKEVGKFFKKGDVITVQPIIKRGSYICPECSAKVGKVAELSKTKKIKCPICDTVLKSDD